MRRGAPKNIDGYRAVIINRIKVYLPKQFDSPYPLSVEVQHFFGLTMLHLAGWKLI